MTTRYKLPEQIDHEDTQKPLFDDTVQKGGYKVVSSVSHRNAIPILKRTIGSLVNIGGEIREYKGSNVSDTNWFNVNNWQLIGTLSRQVVNSTTEIGTEMPSGSIIHDLDSKIIYQLLTTTAITDTITSLIASDDIEIINSSLPYFRVGNIAVSGTVNGRDVSVDGIKLDSIESGAQVNVNADWDSVSGDSEILNKPTDVTDLSAHVSSELSDGADLIKGPALAIDNAIARFDGVTGKLVQNSSTTIDDNGNITINNDSPIIFFRQTDTGNKGRLTLGGDGFNFTWVNYATDSFISQPFEIKDSAPTHALRIQATEVTSVLNINIAAGKTYQINGTQITSLALSDGADLVKGPASAIDNTLPRFDLTTGKLLQAGGSITNLDNGNVGIDTNNPTEKLHVIGNIRSSAEVHAGTKVVIASKVEQVYDAVNQSLKFNFL